MPEHGIVGLLQVNFFINFLFPNGISIFCLSCWGTHLERNMAPVVVVVLAFHVGEINN